jgi:hypothetical protein
VFDIIDARCNHEDNHEGKDCFKNSDFMHSDFVIVLKINFNADKS